MTGCMATTHPTSTLGTRWVYSMMILSQRFPHQAYLKSRADVAQRGHTMRVSSGRSEAPTKWSGQGITTSAAMWSWPASRTIVSPGLQEDTVRLYYEDTSGKASRVVTPSADTLLYLPVTASGIKDTWNGNGWHCSGRVRLYAMLIITKQLRH